MTNPQKNLDPEQFAQIGEGKGFIAALDQSGGSTPKALRLYGIPEDAYSNDDEMFDLVHQMRTRIITSPAFSSGKVIGAILFEQTMDRMIGDKPTATYLWKKAHVVPFLKIDKGLAEQAHGVQMLKPIPGLEDTLDRAAKAGIFGTKERSLIKAANVAGIKEVVAQQFELAKTVLAHGLVPIVEPEVLITIADKAKAEEILREEILEQLEAIIDDGRKIMLKLSLPSVPDFYKPLINHPKVLKVVALSGGYPRAEANKLLAQNPGMIASFSRALTEGLSAQQSDAEFDKTLKDSIDTICEASLA